VKLSRAHAGEWLAGLFGLVLLAGLLLPWQGDASAISSPGFLDLVLLLIALAAVALPVIVVSSSRTNVPIVYETTLWTVSLLFSVVLLVKAFFPPDGGFETGFWLAFAGLALTSFSVWRSVAREH
jgi:hypothetical protein